MISIVNYQAGNAPSVSYALNYLNVPCKLVSRGEELAEATKIILPGVGSAKATMASLADSGFLEPLKQRVLEDEVPFLGICVGLQVLFQHSEEGDADCFGWFPGQVRRFPDSVGPVPQIGWNEVTFTKQHPVLRGLSGTAAHVYFVNSYFAHPDSEEVVAGSTNYGGVEFCSIAARDNIVATQFHVEKSGPIGLKMLRNFAVM